MQIQPKRLFLFDGLGALLSAFLLSAVLTRVQKYIGIPNPTLFRLSLVAGLFACYSLICYVWVKRNVRPFLQLIATANLLYCLFTLALVFIYFSQITVLAIVYFSLEIVVVFSLSVIEFKVSKVL